MQAKSFAATAVIVVPTFPEALRHPTDQLFEGAKTLTPFRHRAGIQDLSTPLLELLWGKKTPGLQILLFATREVSPEPCPHRLDWIQVATVGWESM